MASNFDIVDNFRYKNKPLYCKTGIYPSEHAEAVLHVYFYDNVVSRMRQKGYAMNGYAMNGYAMTRKQTIEWLATKAGVSKRVIRKKMFANPKDFKHFLEKNPETFDYQIMAKYIASHNKSPYVLLTSRSNGTIKLPDGFVDLFTMPYAGEDVLFVDYVPKRQWRHNRDWKACGKVYMAIIGCKEGKRA